MGLSHEMGLIDTPPFIILNEPRRLHRKYSFSDTYMKGSEKNRVAYMKSCPQNNLKLSCIMNVQ